MVLRKLPSLLVFVVCCIGLPQGLPPSAVSIERLYSWPLIQGRSPAAPSMSPDGSKIVFGWNQTGERRLDVWMMDFPSGDKKRIVEAKTIESLPRQDDERTDIQKKDEELYDAGISGFNWAPDSNEFLFSYKRRIWLCAPDGKNLRPLVDSTEPVHSASYSPDGRFIGFMLGINVYRFDRKSGAIKQLTFISKAGTSLDSYHWSPDGKQIAVIWEDESKMGRHVMMDFTKERSEVVSIRRLWHGDMSINIQIGVVSTDGGLIRFIEGLPRYTWLEQVEWSPDSQALAISSITEDFQRFELRVLPQGKMKPVVIYNESAPKNYISDWRPIAWSRDSKFLYLGTDILDGKFANRSILRLDKWGGKPEKVYAENHDVISLSRPKHSDRLILVTMAKSPLESEVTILEPDGKRLIHRPLENGMATPKLFEAGAPPLFSEDGKKIATLASKRGLNPELFALEPRQQRLTESQLPEFKKVVWAEHKEVTFPGPDGKLIHGVLITKPGLDKTKKHPAFISNMYADSAKLAWSGFFENYMAVECGMVVLQVDFRASWGYGGEFNTGYYQSLGVIDADEAVAAKKFLVSLGYVTPERVGVWGWSYGGFLTCMILFTKPGEFHAGAAVASVTDWKTYNEWYTRRRLGMEKDNKEVYKKTSPIFHAAGLKDNLLLIHGMLDDNVLFQDTARLMQKLIENGKYFETALYPKEDHGIGRIEARPHVFGTLARYLYRVLNQPLKKETG